jgi:hypothetical protein
MMIQLHELSAVVCFLCSVVCTSIVHERSIVMHATHSFDSCLNLSSGPMYSAYAGNH